MAMCCKCQTTDDLYLNDILQIICKQCSSDTVTNKYNSELDNYRLGLKTPGSMIFCIRLDCTYIDDEDICFNCHKKFNVIGLQGYSYLPVWLQKRYPDYQEVYFCKKCLYKYNRIQLDKIYANYDVSFEHKFIIYHEQQQQQKQMLFSRITV